VEREETVSAEPPVSAEEARAGLHDLVDRVAATGRMVPITVDGAPAGALVPLSAMDDYHLAPVGGVHTAYAARRAWAATRRAAADRGPVLLTRGEGRAALLVSAAAADAVAAGLPLVEGDVVVDDGGIQVGGRLMGPGVYLMPGGVRLTVADTAAADDEYEE
jgi:prevent-host-death family protein